MANQTKPEYSKESLDDAKKLWATFTQWSKYGTIAIVVILAIMALFLI